MAEKQLIFKEDEIIRLLNLVYNHFKAGQFADAIDKLDKALQIDFEYPGITAALKCANFWNERKFRLDLISEPYERGEFLFNQWIQFAHFCQNIADLAEKCLYSIKQYCFGQALNNYLKIFNKNDVYDVDILFRIGRSYKGIGDYDKAIEFLELANRQKNDAPEVLSELADCYSLVNENRASKAFFREAFFLDPQRIELSFIESAMIHKLVEKLADKDFDEEELKEWIPVYGTIYGIFNIKRELRPLEIGKLKQGIYKMEQILLNNKNQEDKILKPKLINNYFWLIDHYISTDEEKAHINEILTKIENLHPEIYQEYTK